MKETVIVQRLRELRGTLEKLGADELDAAVERQLDWLTAAAEAAEAGRDLPKPL